MNGSCSICPVTSRPTSAITYSFRLEAVMTGCVFISYSLADPEPAQRLLDLLTRQGYIVRPQCSLTTDLSAEVRSAHAVIAIWDSDFIEPGSVTTVVANHATQAGNNKLISLRAQNLNSSHIPVRYLPGQVPGIRVPTANEGDDILKAVRNLTPATGSNGFGSADTCFGILPGPLSKALVFIIITLVAFFSVSLYLGNYSCSYQYLCDSMRADFKNDAIIVFIVQIVLFMILFL